MDFVTPDKRSKIMRGVKSEHTRPEVRLRSLLHGQGYRFRLHRKDLPGRPDLCLPKYRATIFMNGCFWHHHQGCSHGRIPASNRAFWEAKIARTQQRDIRNKMALETLGWNVVTVWECELSNESALLLRVGRELKDSPRKIPLPSQGESVHQPGPVRHPRP